MPPLQYAAPAKLNLYLHVGQPHAEGLHPIESLVVFLDLADQVTLSHKSAGMDALTLSGPFAYQLQKTDPDDNLVMQALRRTGAVMDRWHIHLTKQIPACSGLGGGSADAAALLRAYASYDIEEKHDNAEWVSTLGSDIAACLESKPIFMEGFGFTLSTCDFFPDFGLVLAWPEAGASTKTVYQNFIPGTPERIFTKKSRFLASFSSNEKLHCHDLWIDFLKSCRNDLEQSAITLYPAIGDTLDLMQKIEGFYLVRMTGSGSACFGLCKAGEEKKLANQFTCLSKAKKIEKEMSVFATRPIASGKQKE